jgi:hypothetical protein
MGTISGPNNIADGLVLHLDASNKLSYSGSGNTWYDLSAYSNNATFVDSPSSQILPQAYFNFDGVNDYMTIPRSSSISPVSAITQEVWFNFAPIPNTSVFIGLQYGSSYNNTYALFKESSLLYGGVNVSGSLNVIGIGVSNISGNKWVHFVHTFDGSTQKLYLDGVLQNSASLSGSIQYDSNNTRIVIGADDNGGYNSGTGAFHSGKLNQVKIYNRALSSEEITRNYISQRKRYFPEENIVTNGLVLYIDPAKYSSYAGSGNSISSISGIGYSGTLINGPTFSNTSGGSFALDGVDDYIFAPIDTNLFSTEATMIIWLKNDAAIPTVYNTGFLGFGQGQSNDHYPWVNGAAYLSTFRNIRVEGITLSSTINRVLPHMVSVTTDSSNWKLYQNSTLQHTTSSTGTVYLSRFTIGYSINSFFYRGDVYAFMIYNRALTESEITQNYNAMKSRFGI